MIDELLRKYGLKYDDLNIQERETLHSWLQSLNQGTLTLEKVKEYITSMMDAVSAELENEPEFIRILIFKLENRKQILLKARLRNYRLLLMFLSAPDKAKKALEGALANLKVQ